jgi:hypothetical protein
VYSFIEVIYKRTDDITTFINKNTKPNAYSKNIYQYETNFYKTTREEFAGFYSPSKSLNLTLMLMENTDDYFFNLKKRVFKFKI